MDRAVPAGSAEAPVDPAVVARVAVVLADEVDSTDLAGPVVVVPARAVAADRAAVKADSADPADPAQASATASVKAGRIFAA